MPARPPDPGRTPRGAVLADEWRDLTAAVLVALAVEIGLRTVPLPRLARVLGAPVDVSEATAPAGPPRLGDRDRRRALSADRVMRRWPWGGTCLRRALVLGQRLRRLHPVLRVGVAKVDGVVSAHAWLEVDGASLDPSGAATFLPLRGSSVPARGLR